MSEWAYSGDHCAICSNTLNVSIFDPKTPNAEADPLMSLFIGAKLCEECVSVLVRECARDVGDEERMRDETELILSVRTVVATKIIGRPKFQSWYRFVCEVCRKNEATKIHPAALMDDEFADYYGRFYCEECAKSRGQSFADYLNDVRDDPVTIMIKRPVMITMVDLGNIASVRVPAESVPVEKVLGDRCFICSNIEDVDVFDPMSQREDTLISFFIGRRLCKCCAELVAKSKMPTPSHLVIGMRSYVAHLIQCEPSQLSPRQVLCEACGKYKATKLDPGTSLYPVFDENYIEYLGRFYCEKCYAEQAHSSESLQPMTARVPVTKTCSVCNSSKDVDILDPQTNRDDPVVSFFTGKNLCRICSNTMLLNANAGDKERTKDPARFALGVRSQTAYYIQFKPSKLTGRMNILCEACRRNHATRLEPGTKLNDDLENLSEYRGKFYCEKCSDAEVQNRARAHESLSGDHCSICSNTLNVSIFDPKTPNAEADPLMSSFIGAKLCEECVSTLVSECAKDPDDEERIVDRTRFILFIRTLIATRFIGRPKSQGRGRFVCEVCWRDEATKLHPSTLIDDSYPAYYGRFYCEGCAKSRGQSNADYLKDARDDGMMVDDIIWVSLRPSKKGPKDRCFICANIKDIDVFNPESHRDDPLILFFIGHILCKSCESALDLICQMDVNDEGRISDPSQLVVGIRSQIAYLIQYEPSKLPPREIACEICEKDRATKLKPGTRLNPKWDENFTQYRGRFYCEKCYANRARSTEFFLPKVERPSEEEVEF